MKTAFENAYEFRRPIEAKWNYWFRLANNIPPKNRSKWMTNRSLPYTQAIVDLIVPRLYSGLPKATVVGRTLAAAVNQDDMNQLLDYQQDVMKLEVMVNDLIKQAVMYGLACFKIGWKKETAKNIPHTGKFLDKMKSYLSGLGFKVKNDDLLYDDPIITCPDTFNVFWDEKATSDKDASFIIERNETSKYQLRQDPTYEGALIDSIATESEDVDKTKRERLTMLGYTTNQAKKLVEKGSGQFIEILDYWGAFDIDGDGIEEECHIVLANRETVLLMEENPYYDGRKPFRFYVYDRMPGFFCGKGVVERVASLQEELNDAGNQASDMRKLTLSPVMKVRKGARVNLESLKFVPGMPIFLDNPETDLIFERMPDFTEQLEIIQKSAKEMMQMATGATDVIIGQNDVGLSSNTATGVSIAQEQSSMRFRQPAILLDIFMEEVGEALISRNQQFFDRKRTIPVMKDGMTTYKEIAPETIMGSMSYKVQTGSMNPQSATVRQTQLVNMKNLLMNNPDYDQKKIDDMIVQSFNVDPSSVKVQSQASGEALQKLQQLPPALQQAAIAKLSPQQQELVTKALQNGQPAQPSLPQPGNPAPGQPGAILRGQTGPGVSPPGFPPGASGTLPPPPVATGQPNAALAGMGRR